MFSNRKKAGAPASSAGKTPATTPSAAKPAATKAAADAAPAVTSIRAVDDAPRPILLEIPEPTGARYDAEPVFRIDHPLYEAETRAEWIAGRLLADDDLFTGKVHVPAKKGGKTVGGAKAITYATFRGVVDHMLREAPRVEAVCLPDELIAEAVLDGPNSLTHHKVEQGGQLLARLFLHYWRAVAHAFDEAWNDHHDHLLWHPHGLAALGSLGSRVVQDQVDSYDIRQHYFDEVLEAVAAKVSLKKSDHSDVAAHDMTDHLLGLLASARASSRRTAGLAAVPGTVGSIDWGSSAAPLSPDVDLDIASAS